MSWGALAWAGKCKPGSASMKLVLLALADRHNEEAGGSYPSVKWLTDFTDLNRKTIITALADLEAKGFISDSGKRCGQTMQVKVYKLHVETVPKSEQFQNRNSTVFSVKQSQKRDTEPSKEPVDNITNVISSKPARVSKPELPDWLPVDAWNGWVAMRVGKRAKPTTRAIELAIAKLDGLRSQGHDPGAVLDQSTLKGWTDLYPIKESDNAHQYKHNDGKSVGRTQAAAMAVLARLEGKRDGIAPGSNLAISGPSSGGPDPRLIG